VFGVGRGTGRGRNWRGPPACEGKGKKDKLQIIHCRSLERIKKREAGKVLSVNPDVTGGAKGGESTPGSA